VSSDDFMMGRMTRAQVLRRAAALGLGVSSLPVLAACGSDDSAPASTASGSAAAGPPAAADVKGNIVLLNYPGWMGPKTVPGFQSAYPGTKVKQTAAGFESLSGVAQAVAQNPSAYDVMLAVTDQCQQLQAGGFVLEVDDKVVPNMKNVDERIRKLYPWGVAADTGAIGIGYRKDLVKEPIRSWGDFWKLVPKYSKKVVMVGVDRDVIGSALLYLGKDGNSTSGDDLAAAKKAVLDLKPHVRAFKVTDVAKTMLQGSAVLTMGYNYETAAAAAKNPNIEFVVPEEGVIGWVEGFIGISKTDNVPTVEAFLNYLGEPKVLAAHTNTVFAGGVSSAAKAFTDKALLAPAYDLPQNATILKFLGADGVKLWNKTWSQIQAA
jgi:spermidine/putrescine-binding protein